jgi:uncharacterized protein (TIGR03437 family)
MSARLLAASVFLTCASAQVTLQSTATIQIPGSVTVLAGDFNNDGNLDLATVGVGQTLLQVFPGNGDGTFGAAISSKFPCAIISRLASGHFDASGNLGIVGYCQSAVTILPGKGNGAFGTAVQLAVPGVASGGTVGVADLNGDGFLDLAIPGGAPNFLTGTGEGSGGIYTFFGNGDGTFQSSVQVGASTAQTLVITDTNLDGWPDIVALEPNYETIAIYLNQGNGQFKASGAASSVLPVPLFLTSADLNGDGFPDFVIVSNDYPNNCAVLFGNGSGGFLSGPPLLIPTNGTPWTIPADLRGTGVLDLVMATAESENAGTLIIEPGNGDGTFGSPINIAAAAGLDIAIADFNGDGKDDVALVTSTGQIVGLNAPPAQIEVLLSTTPLSFANANSASFQRGPLAAGSIASAFTVKGGAQLATSASPAGAAPSMTLGGASITVTDSAGVARPTELFYASPTQVNYLVPVGTASGPATIALNSGFGTLNVKQEISPVEPGIYAIDGVADAEVLTAVNNTQTFGYTFQQNPSGGYSPAPISLGSSSTEVFLVLFGTGLANHTSPVLVHIGDMTIAPTYAGAQGAFAGEDQIDVQIPTSLRGAGVIGVSVTADGLTSNIVQIQIE